MDEKTTEEYPILATKRQTLVYTQPQLATMETKSPLLTLGHKTANKKEIMPERAQEEVIRRHHDRPLHGHPRQDKTLEKIQRNYHFDRMKCKVTEFIRNCEQCAKNKPSRHKLYRQAQQIDLPKAPWETIMIDFVVKLPKSTDHQQQRWYMIAFWWLLTSSPNTPTWSCGKSQELQTNLRASYSKSW